MPHIKKLADGKYLIRVSRGTGSRRKWINETFDGTLKQARTRGREIEAMLDGGTAIDAAISFEKYFTRWIAAVKPRLAPRTLDGYEGYIRRYALDRLGSVRLSNIRTANIQEVLADCQRSPTTVRNLHAALRACFSYAIRGGILRTNPAKNVDLPRKIAPEHEVMTFEEAAIFTQICRTMPNGLIFEFALQTGMRPEEYLALRWRDLSLPKDTRGEAFLQQAVQFNRKGGGYYFKELKTQRSRRRVPFSDDLAARLRRHRIDQNEHRLKMGSTWVNHDLVFPNSIGRPYALNNLTRRYLMPILDACKFEKHFHLYSLRHSCATMLLMLNENSKTVADRLGSSVKMILETYSHVLPHIQDNATDRLANVLRAK